MARRTLLSAALAGSLFASDLALLVLFLNPETSLRREAVALFLGVFLPYGACATVALLLLALLGAAVRGWPRAPRPPIEGLPAFTSMTLVAVGVATSLYWLNLLSYRYSVPVEAVRALAAAAVSLIASALVLVAVAVDAALFPRRGRGVSAALFVLSCAAAVVVPLALRPVPMRKPPPVAFATETVEPVRRVILVGFDGLGPEQIRDGISRGHLPTLGRLLKRGASGPLATLRPTEGPPIWTTIFTGRLPRDHGVKSFITYRLPSSQTAFEILPKGALVGLLERVGLVSTSPVTAVSRRSRTLWNALNAFGISTGVVRFWGTYPPERLRGFMLSHYFHVLRQDPTRVAETLYPPDLVTELTARAVDPQSVDRALVSQFIDLSVEVPGDKVPWRRDLVERALAPDMTYQRAGAVLRAAYDPPFFATYFYGLDVVGHRFMRFAHPERFGDVRPEEVRRYGNVLERYMAYVGQSIGELAQGLRPNEVLVVVSAYGIEPVPLWRRLLGGWAGEAPMSGTHEGAPDGFFIAIGDGVRAGATLQRGSVLDVAPTLLYLMGLPVARDMEGRVAAEIFEEEFARAHPVTFIPSYESLAVTPVAGRVDAGLPPLPDDVP